ncbi:hypothetical protein ACFTXO_30270, partial [Streptomyces sp. NPDC057067]
MTRHQQKWTAGDIPDQTGRVAVVTGATSGLGLATTEARVPPRAHAGPARAPAEMGGARAAARPPAARAGAPERARPRRAR